jgi:ABC-type lipopolysaccharide export system ATPase subunit
MSAGLDMVVPVLLTLAPVMAGTSLAALVVALMAKREVLEQRRAAEEAEAQALLLQNALEQERRKRSQAVSKGNRTRAERQRLKVLETAEAVRLAAAEKKLPPQGNLL